MAVAFNGDPIIYYNMDAQQDWHGPIWLALAIWLSNIGSMPLLYLLTQLTN